MILKRMYLCGIILLLSMCAITTRCEVSSNTSNEEDTSENISVNHDNADDDFEVLDNVEEIIAEVEEEGTFQEMSSSILLNTEDECERYSPNELFYREIQPLIEASLDEVLQFTSSLLGHLRGGVSKLQSRTNKSPLGRNNSEEVFLMMQDFVNKQVKRSAGVILHAWRSFITDAHALDHDGDIMNKLQYLLQELKENHVRAEDIIAAVLQELSVNVKAIIMNGVNIVKDDNNTEDASFDDETDRLPKVDLEFYSIVMKKIIERGIDASKYQKIKTDVFRKSFKAIKQMIEDVEEMIKGNINQSNEIYNNDQRYISSLFWKNTIIKSQERLSRRPLPRDDFERVYSNLEFLSEMTLSLLATW